MSRKLIAFLSILSLFLSTPIISVNAAPKAGAKCNKAGSTQLVKDKRYKCVKTGNKLAWNKGVTVAPSKNTDTPLVADSPTSIDLSFDPRITAISELASVGTCKTGDLSPNPAFNNGFPRPQSVIEKTSIKILALPVIFDEIPFTDNDMVKLNKALIDVAYTYSIIAMGRLSVKFEIAKKENWVKMEKSAAQYGIMPSGPQQNNSIIAKDAVALASSDIDFNLYDGVLIESAYSNLTSVAQGMAGEFFTAKNGTTAKRVSLQLGQASARASTILHEMGHTLFALEDIYIFLNSRRPSVPDPNPAGQWDIMSYPTTEMFGWNKLLMGWIKDEEIRCIQSQTDSNHFLVNISNPSGPKLVLVNLSFGKTIALEARNGIGNNGLQELLVYKIDSSIDHGDGPITARKSLISSVGVKTVFDSITIELLAKSKDGVLFNISKSQ